MSMQSYNTELSPKRCRRGAEIPLYSDPPWNPEREKREPLTALAAETYALPPANQTSLGHRCIVNNYSNKRVLDQAKARRRFRP